jgi:hypothetical protein
MRQGGEEGDAATKYGGEEGKTMCVGVPFRVIFLGYM